MNILVSEDEKDIRNLLKVNLEQEGYSVFVAQDGLEALSIIQSVNIDLAVLDIMMPRLDGLNLLRKIRETHTFPVIFLTARTDDMDKILGLGLGADDYLAKPFSMAELLARIGAQLRRSCEYSSGRTPSSSRLAIGCLVLDKDACSVYKDGAVIELNAKEYKLLHLLMENADKVFTKRQLYKAVWDEDIYYDDNTIMVHISHLRNKIEKDPRNPEFIKTIRGIGYKFQRSDEGIR